MGWGGTDCSLAIQVTTHSATQMPPSSNTTLSMKRNEVIYGKRTLDDRFLCRCVFYLYANLRATVLCEYLFG